MSEIDNDKDLRESWRQLPQPQPSAELDRRVLLQAQAAIHRGPRFHLRWGAGAAAAALLCFALLLPVQQSSLSPESITVPSDAPSPKPSEPDSSSADSAVLDRIEVSGSRLRTAPPAEPMPVAPSAPAASGRLGQAAGEAKLEQTRAAESPEEAAVSMGTSMRDSAEPTAQAELEAVQPQQEMARIEQLLEAGQREAAVRALARLLRGHPDLVLTPALSPLREAALAEPAE
ncbi:hypothetical protein [Pseudomarimonas arenosa]|uniref:FimV-like protein n=1 Tax=Pseudomarimonas arenosa TaxID=2774145 RepID=A0AAW3ZGR6_9GAMM|nr:hypothetical protein [Pseudomarimonas arenosa]MBD8524337.1 hypothetical protein [Pseudomarimonas arenosa]